ncbi:hypothetical protein HOF40_04280 [Candidatus Parcubacteria bacterium]|jgi:hypothetical protein|nr:hypothetical protein [Candidatus Parcubacteria bacterium]MBT3949280.1 hypothetical protein [Candidatus Parcubacteria bacterium]
MPVKKSTNKKESAEKKPRKKRKAAPKKTTTKKNKEKKELEQAVKKIPALVMKEIDAKESGKIESVYTREKYIDRKIQKPGTLKTKKVVPIYEPPHKGKTWLWVGVIIFSVAILVLWALNLSTMFYESKRSYDPAQNIIESGKQDLQNIIKTFSDKEESEKTIEDNLEKNKEDVTEDVENAIKETLSNIFNTTSTPSSTPTTNTIQLEL